MLNKNTQQKGNMPAWFGVTIIILAAFISAILIVINIQPKQLEINQLSPQPIIQKEPVYSYVGLIQRLDENQIQVLALASRNSLKADKLITVLVNEDTLFTKLTIPKQIPVDLSDTERQNLFSRETVGLLDLKINDDVTVVAEEDISSASSFTASRIQVREIK